MVRADLPSPPRPILWQPAAAGKRPGPNPRIAVGFGGTSVVQADRRDDLANGAGIAFRYNLREPAAEVVLDR